MKGLTHFIVGLTAAAMIPESVRAAASGNPLYLLLGGIFGLLPDTLDFKFYRFFYRHDIEVMPDPDKPDARMIADAVAHAVNKAWSTGSCVKIKLGTVRKGADLWQRYSIRFDVREKRVTVAYGPIVDTGGNPATDAVATKGPSATAALACDITLDYEAETTVDIFDGPLLRMTPTPDGPVRIEFIPWHRDWSHSLTVGAVFGLAGAALWNPLAGTVIFLAYAMHALADQMGFMGVNFFYPFRRGRRPGFGLMRSTEAWPNFATVWLCCLLIFWSLAQNTAGTEFRPGLVRLIIGAGVMPVVVFLLADRLMRGKQNLKRTVEPQRNAE